MGRYTRLVAPKRIARPGKLKPIDPEFGDERPLFDPGQEVAATESPTDIPQEWQRTVLDTLLALAQDRATLTVEDLEDRLDPDDLIHPLGPILRRGERNGWVTPTREFIPARNGHPVRVWESVLVKHRSSRL